VQWIMGTSRQVFKMDQQLYDAKPETIYGARVGATVFVEARMFSLSTAAVKRRRSTRVYSAHKVPDQIGNKCGHFQTFPLNPPSNPILTN